MERRDSYLQSKIQTPTDAPHFILRPRLIDMISGAAERLVVLSASMGYGKTVLLTHCAHRIFSACAWYHLGETDNDTAVFMHYLSRAVGKVFPEFSFQIDHYAALPQDDEWIESMGRDFAASLHVYTEGELGIVLDDFQHIDNPMIYSLLQIILGYMPGNMRLIIATKGAIPAFSIRYMLQGEALVLGQSDLSFSLEEVRGAIGAIVKAEEIDQMAESIHRVAEGWPAGVRFSLLYMRHRRAGTGESLTDVYNRGMVHDYFMHELFRKMPFDLQQFLVKTSVLDMLSGDICNAVTGRSDAQGILGYLEQENIFTVRMGEGSGSQFRYHSIFRDFLMHQIRPEVRREVLDIAARFHLRGSNKELAVEYAMMAEDSDLAQMAIEAVGMYMVEQGKTETLARWLVFLRERSVSLTARNNLIFGSYYYRVGDNDRAVDYIDRALSLSIEAMDEMSYVNAMLQKARILRDQVSLEASCAALDSVLPRLRSRGGHLSHRIITEKLYNLIHMGRYNEALATCNEMILRARASSGTQAESFFMRFSAIALFYLGQYGQAITAYEMSAGSVMTDDERAREYSAGAYMALVYAFRGDYDHAKSLIDREVGIRAGRAQQGDFWMVQLLKACVYMLCGRAERIPARRQSLSAEGLEALRVAEHLSGHNRKNRDFFRITETVGKLIRFCFVEEYSDDRAAELLALGCALDIRGLRDIVLGCLAARCYGGGNYLLARAAADRCVGEIRHENVFTACGRTVLSLLLPEPEGADSQRALAAGYLEKNSVDIPRVLLLPDSAGQEGSMNRILVRCFGGFEVRLPGEEKPVKWRTRKAQELFAYLFHLQGEEVERDQLLCRLWPDMPTENAVSLLHTTLYSIRKMLTPHDLGGLIEYNHKRYSINVGMLDSQFGAMNMLCRAMDRGQYEALYNSRAVLLDCEGSYMGSLGAEWPTAQREYFETMWLKCCKYVAGRLFEDEAYDEAALYLKKYIAVDPFAEFIYEMLIQCFGMMGDVRGIKTYYDRLKDVMLDELGVRPSARVREVYYHCMSSLSQRVSGGGN